MYPNTLRFVVYLPYSERTFARPFYISGDAGIEILENDIRQDWDYKPNLEGEKLCLFKVPLNSSSI